MTREQAKEILPIIEAFSKGKTVERFNPCNGEWDELKDPSFDLDNSCYRIKREPKYKPFENQEECWNEMLKHQPFGWVTDGYYKSTISVKEGSIVLAISSDEYSYKDAVKTFRFVDGTPFGINDDLL